MKPTLCGLAILLLAPLGIAHAQKQEDALAAAARRARAEKKDQPKATKVWDNDTISQITGQINVVGEAPAAAPAAEAKPPAGEGGPGAAGEAKTEAKATGDEKSAVEADLAAAKEKIASLKVDLDILQRKYTLDQQVFYGKPDYASDTAGAAALQDEQNQINSKQQEVTDAQKKIDELQEKLKSLSGAETGKNSP